MASHGRFGMLARHARGICQSWQRRYTAEASGDAVSSLVRSLNPEQAKALSEGLTVEQKKVLLRSLAEECPQEFVDEFFSELDVNSDGFLSKGEFSTAFGAEATTGGADMDRSTLFKIGLANGMPFVGFGFVDNAIMIFAGETIEMHFGLMLGISTMAAAALGNLISDVGGVAIGGTIETTANKLGFEMPHLTRAQTKMRVVRLTKAFGASIGVSLGCALGMFPLLLYDYDLPMTKEQKDAAAAAAAAPKKAT